MPHAVYNVGAVSTTGDRGARSLVPGIEPGGSRVGQETKPALLIRDAFVEEVSMSIGGDGNHGVTTYLKLSQELDLTPGQLLLVHKTTIHQTAAGIARVDASFRGFAGSVWVPRVVGIRHVETGNLTWDHDVHLDYERIDVPWIDYMVMWDFLDNTVDNEREY